MKYNLLSVSVLAALSASAFQVNAQEPESSTNEEELEVITVTGSNIKNIDLEEAQPLVVISADDIARSGATSLSELMRSVNQTRGGTSTFTTAQSGATSTSTPPGQAAISLRGMGPSSTLTLVNGRRVAVSSFASGTENFVDVNSIPLSAIERVEVLATGASAVYGADAVAGVINYVLKKDFEGFEVSGSFSDSDVSESEQELSFQLLYGVELENGNFTVFADYYDRDPVLATTREFTATPILQSGYSYLATDTPNIYFRSTRSGDEIGNPECAQPFTTTEFGEEICAYYGNQDDYLETPLESTSVGFIFTQEFDDITWQTDFIFNRSDSTSFSSPAPINQVDDREGPFVHESVIDSFSDALFNAVDGNIFIDPFDTIAGQELFGFQFDARFSQPRTVEVESQSWRLVSQLEGVWDDWDWRAGITASFSESEQKATKGIYNRFKYHAALAGELCSDGSIANYDPDADSLSCTSGNLLEFYNPFDSSSPDNLSLLALTQEVPTRDGESELYIADFLITGDLTEINGHTLSSAFGLEIRHESVEDIPSENARARFENGYLVDVFGFGSSLSTADRTLYGAFAEFNLPISDTFDINAAGRYDYYDDFGSTFNPRVGFTFRPDDTLVVRGSWSTAFRAPSLTQAGVQLRTTRASFDCGANQTIANLYCEGDSVLRGNNVLELGNPDLNAEESESFNVGIAWMPNRNTEVTIDYWQFEHEELVDTNMTGVLARALTDASLRHCGLVPEGEQGISYDPFLCLYTDAQGRAIEEQGADLEQILQEWIVGEDPRFLELPLFRDHVLSLENTGTQDLEGIDFNVFHAIELDTGDIEIEFSGTHYLSFERNIPGSDDVEELAGSWRYPENVAALDLFWVSQDWFAGATVFYTDAYEDDIDRLRGREVDELFALGVLTDEEPTRDVSSWTTVDFSAGYYFENFEVRLRIENLFDRDAPISYASARGYDSFNHDPFGRRYTISATYSF